MNDKKIQTALDKGKTLIIKTSIGDARIGKGPASLRKWLDSGPHGEAAQDSIDHGYHDEYDDYDDY